MQRIEMGELAAAQELFDDGPVTFSWGYNRLAIEKFPGMTFVVRLRDKENNIVLQDEKGPKKKDDRHSVDVAFPGMGTYQFTVQAAKGRNTSNEMRTHFFDWGEQLPDPFDLAVSQSSQGSAATGGGSISGIGKQTSSGQ